MDERQQRRADCGDSHSLRGRWRAARRCGLSVLRLVRLVVADGATGGSADKAMMTGKMPCSAAHQGALDAPFGISWYCYGDERDRNRGASKCLVHTLLLPAREDQGGEGTPPQTKKFRRMLDHFVAS
jgi:hypothetical protein